ncbi:MAG: hypothetical protein JNJ98_16915 [Gemmatimonadetes bacterium]|nr:hypothetical protein [Gemmatimonadota bacterium]
MRSILFSLVALNAAAALPAAAQAPRNTAGHTSADAVVLARVPRLSDARAHVMVIRRPVSPTHLILAGPTATPLDIAAAMSGLLRARRLDGDTPRLEQRAIITDAERRRARPSAGALAAATRDFALLQRAGPMNIRGFNVLAATVLDGRLQRVVE